MDPKSVGPESPVRATGTGPVLDDRANVRYATSPFEIVVEFTAVITHV